VWLASLLGLAAIGLTFTRASWAGTVLGLAILIVLLGRRRQLRWGPVFAIGIAVVAAAVVLLPTMSARLTQDYGANAQAAAWDERWGLMRIAFNMIVHHPVTGVGAGAYNYTYKPYIPAGVHQWIAAVHNEFLLRAAETGLIGLIAFVALMVAAFRIGARLLRSPRPQFVTVGAGWIAAMCSLIWQMSWVPWTGFTYNAMLWFAIGLMDGACKVDRQMPAHVSSQAPDASRLNI
jgi:O-antigen ligase